MLEKNLKLEECDDLENALIYVDDLKGIITKCFNIRTQNNDLIQCCEFKLLKSNRIGYFDLVEDLLNYKVTFADQYLQNIYLWKAIITKLEKKGLKNLFI